MTTVMLHRGTVDERYLTLLSNLLQQQAGERTGTVAALFATLAGALHREHSRRRGRGGEATAGPCGAVEVETAGLSDLELSQLLVFFEALRAAPADVSSPGMTLFFTDILTALQRASQSRAAARRHSQLMQWGVEHDDLWDAAWPTA